MLKSNFTVYGLIKKAVIGIIDVVYFNSLSEISEFKAYWGKDNISLHE